MAENIGIVFAGVTLFILYTVTVLGGAAWLQNKLDSLKTAILKDLNSKHSENSERVGALEELVIRHDTILQPEFSGRRNRLKAVRKNHE